MKKYLSVPAAALAGGLVALVVLPGCGREPSVASKSAAAFEEARKRGETFGGEGHAHGGHEAAPGAAHEMTGTGQESGEAAGPSGMAMEGMDHSGMAMGQDHSGKAMEGMHHSGTGMGDMDHSGMEMGKDRSGKSMKGMDHSGMAMGGDHAGTATGAMDHSGMAMDDEQSGKAMEGMDHSGMAMGGATPSTEPLAVAASPGQPALSLRPDPLDSPAATSVLDARRSAEMAGGMAGMAGHGGHGEGIYRHVDVGRGPEAYEGSEPQTPGGQPHRHGGPGPSSGHEEHSQHEPPAGGIDETTVYVCPMHPEVTSKTPGTCPKCGMTLVERRKE